MNTLNLKPAAGLKVIDPDTRKALPEDGDQVRESSYWHRRLADGDVVAFTPSKKIKRADPSAESRSKS